MLRKRHAEGPPARSPFLNRIARSSLTGDICREMVTHLMRGDWREGEQIPTERELCRLFGSGSVLREGGPKGA